jgi:ABC-type uncharacterized transport system permease subunit
MNDFLSIDLLARWLVLTYLGSAFLILYKAGFVNLAIGAQLIGAALVACYLANALQTPWGLFIVGPAAFLMAAGIGLVAIFLKYYCDVSEILTTLFISFLAAPIGQYAMKPSPGGAALLVASPVVPDMMQFGLQINSHTSYLHWGALLSVLICATYFGPAIVGYKTRAMAANIDVFPRADARRLVRYANWISALFIALVVLADTYSVKRRYLAGDYDTLGFTAAAVGLLALQKEWLILIAALGVASIERFALTMNICCGWPQESAQIVYGSAILCVALWDSRRKRNIR